MRRSLERERRFRFASESARCRGEQFAASYPTRGPGLSDAQFNIYAIGRKQSTYEGEGQEETRDDLMGGFGQPAFALAGGPCLHQTPQRRTRRYAQSPTSRCAFSRTSIRIYIGVRVESTLSAVHSLTGSIFKPITYPPLNKAPRRPL